LVILCVGDPVLPINSWPDTWYTWLMTTVTQKGQTLPLMIKGQLAVVDTTRQYSCRYNQQNLINASDERATDMCDFTTGWHYRLADVSIDAKCDEMAKLNDAKLLPWQWPDGFSEKARYTGTDKVSQAFCDHFYASLNVSGTVVQLDVWTANDTIPYPCQLSIFELESDPEIHVTWAFDGFSKVIPHEAGRCTAAEIVCEKPDWVCSAKEDTDEDALGAALQWVCDPTYLDCAPINPGGLNFEPNTVYDHCNWAFNEYYQHFKALDGAEACNFGGIAKLGPPSNTTTMASRNKPQKFWSEKLDTFMQKAFGLLYPLNLACS